ncbi:hypothetical protein [Streptomyces doebereineriae]|uniref:Uncharacterized protein n=1 Tax=Streptomyces doebereineriae TaxID=3075528 RepID=A0ABU2VH85_9ACTN|nr:hypothetical protein [Streptomyces sp. DSM 41640]MDT0484600.1 hypothetical protein [Streptomyces sp. DSM 41640]
MYEFSSRGRTGDADVYLCGCVPSMRTVRTQPAPGRHPARHMRYESLVPDPWPSGRWISDVRRAWLERTQRRADY